MMQGQIEGQMVIGAERFTLRPVRKSDAGLMTLYAGDERVARMTTDIPHPLPPGASEMFLDRVMAADSEELVWAIDASAHGQGELLGLISLTHVTDTQSEVGYWVAPQFWNSGLASAALNALVQANPCGDTSLVASVFQDNPASARVVTQAGFSLIGESETFSVARNALVPTWDYLLQYDQPML